MSAQTVAPSEAKPLARWVPRALWVVTAIHLLFGLLGDAVWLEILRDGVVGTAWADDDLLSAERSYTLYFTATGIPLLAMAQLAQDRVRTTGRLPLYVGVNLLAFGVLVCTVQFPITGAWMILAIGVFAVWTSLLSPPRLRE
ncbi:DUF6463 family protein [Nocardioides speluncae]|uniref:DUF6463 family protein n=1 Tax=Nocardioides speluncae TaxID=2670337 RepID=UPI0023E85F12|nr:DUF6463 family protein [Nocardioides speluncae]